MIFDILMCINIFLLTILKGGFFSSDMSMYIFITTIIFSAYVFVKRKEIKIDKLDILFLLFSLSFVLPIIFTNVPNLNASIYEFLKYFSVFMSFFIIRRGNIKRYICMLVICALIQGFLGIDQLGNKYLLEFLRNFNTGYLTKHMNRLSGTLQYANTTAILLTISSIFVFKKLIERTKENINKNTNKNTNKSIIQNKIIFVIFNLLNIFLLLTDSRIPFIIYIILLCVYMKKNIFIALTSLVFSFLAYINITSMNFQNIYVLTITYMIAAYLIAPYIIKINNFNNKYINISVIIILILMLLIPNNLTTRLKEYIKNPESESIRIEYIKDGFKMFKDSPIVGRGGEAFRYLHKEYQDIKYTSTEMHSSILQIFLETGLIGGILLLAIIYFSLKINFSFISLAYLLHLCVDLNFAFLFGVIIFIILICYKDKNKENNNDIYKNR